MSKWFKIPPGDPYFCVVGSPIAHSKSPDIHLAFGRQCGIALRYERVEIPADCFASAVTEFVAAGGRGMSITVPLKEEAFRALSTHRPRAALTGAANMMTVTPNGTTIGDNADGTGLVRDLVDNHGLNLGGRRVLLLGAGGAARGVIPSLLEARPSALIVANRTIQKADYLVRRFHDLGSLQAFNYRDVPDGPYDLIVNATSLSLSGEIPPLSSAAVGAETCCYDMMYTADGHTRFLDWCRDNGAAACYDGLGMLVEQAANSFALWHGVEPDTGPIIKGLR
jgi:shikimate dehydrogenase